MKNDFAEFQPSRVILWLTAILLLSIGLGFLLGWLTDTIHLFPGTSFRPMQPNTTICLSFSGLSLVFTIYRQRLLAILAASVVILLSLISIYQYVFNINFGMDQIAIYAEFQSAYPFPGQISVVTAICFIMSSICLILTALPYDYFRSICVEILSCMSIAIACISLYGYAFQIYSIINWNSLSGMALHTAISLIIFNIGLFLCHTIYSFYKDKILIGPIIGSIFLTLFSTFFLWQGFNTSHYLNIQKIAQNNAEFMAHILEITVDDMSKSLRRTVLRWGEVKGYNKSLWDIDSICFDDGEHGFSKISWYNDKLQLQWTSPTEKLPNEDQTDLIIMEKIHKIKLKELPTPINHIVINQYLFFLHPLFSSNNNFEGILISKFDLKKLMTFLSPPFILKNYNVEIKRENDLNKNSELDSKAILMGRGVATLTGPYLEGLKIVVTPSHDDFSGNFLLRLILISGLLFTLFLSLIIYLLQLVFQTKEKTTAALKEKANALAYRQAVLDSSSYSIISTDENGIILSFNKAAENMLLWTAKEVIQKHTPVIFHDHDEMVRRAKELSAQFETDISPGFDVFVKLPSVQEKAEIRDWTYVRKDGSRLPVRLSVTPVKNSQGVIIGYVGIAYDLSEIKHIERMKNELIAITSHELRSPLASIKGALDIISRSESFTSQELSFIRIAQNNCERLIRLTSDILDIQKMESGKMEFLFTEFTVNDLFDKTLEINQVYASNNNVTLRLPKNIPDCIVYGDEDRILQVMTNFISNAIKNSPKNGEISFEVDKKGNFVRIGVKDQGPGVPKEYQSLLFEKFFQVPSHKQNKIGTGLGLSICKAIIEKHGGKIGFDTGPGGSTFWFEVPIKPS